MTFVKSVVKTAVDYGYHRKYHRRECAEAKRILETVEQDKGKLPESDRKRCDDYAMDVFGHRRYAPWLYVYTAVAGRFKEGWIPENYYGFVVVPRIKRQYGYVSSVNCLNAAVFQSDAFPDLLSYANGIFFDTQYRFVTEKEAKSILFRDQDTVIYKLDSSRQGRGIHFIRRDTFSVERLQQLGSGLFQRPIKQHELFSRFAAHSVANIRITTVYQDNGEVSVRACYLRLGASSDTHVRSVTQIRVPIDLESGAFNDVAYTSDWAEITAHPGSGEQFAGNVIPGFRTCIDTVTELHGKVPYARSVGWDVAVDGESRAKVMEWNAGHNSIKFSEATQGPGFADLGWENLVAARR